MATTVELMNKEDQILKKAKEAHKARTKKLEDIEFKRILKMLKQTKFLKTPFSDAELLEGFNKMIDWKNKRDEQSPMQLASTE